MDWTPEVNAQRPPLTPAILRPDALPSRNRGGGATTVPLVTAARGATSYLNGITKFGPAAAIDHHTHNTAESVMVIKGEAIVDIDGERTRLRTYDTTFVPANIPHHFENLSSDEEMWIMWTYGSLNTTRTILSTGVRGRIDEEDPEGSALIATTAVHEIAEIDVTLGREADFEAAVAAAVPLFQSAPGARTLTLERSQEYPSRYRLVVGWDSVDDHLVGFRNSPAYAQWRDLVGEYFAEPPRVEHVRNVLTAF